MVKTLAQIEKECILGAILNHGSITKAAAALAIPKATIYRKLRSYGFAPGRRIMVNHLVQQLKNVSFGT